VAKASKGIMAIGSLTVAVGGSFDVKKLCQSTRTLKRQPLLETCRMTAERGTDGRIEKARPFPGMGKLQLQWL
jgi:hypothetical protein